jgi:hypothetical protein
MAPVPIGPIGIGSSGGSHEEPTERELEHSIGRCKRCGKEAELVDGLCTECKWEIGVGLQHPLQKEKKRHFWSRDKR